MEITNDKNWMLLFLWCSVLVQIESICLKQNKRKKKKKKESFVSWYLMLWWCKPYVSLTMFDMDLPVIVLK